MNIVRILGLVLGIWGLIVISACEQVEVTNEATADAFIKTIVSDEDTLFGIAHSVYSFNRMSSVSVKSPTGLTFQLTGNSDGGISIFKDPSVSDGDYSKDLPTPGMFTYTVTFKNNEEKDYTNTLGADFLLPAVIDSLAKSQDGSSVILKWNRVESAQFYQIRVTKGSTEVIAAFLVPQADDLRIELPYSYFSGFAPGSFTVELDALLYESTNYMLLQAESISYGSIDLP